MDCTVFTSCGVPWPNRASTLSRGLRLEAPVDSSTIASAMQAIVMTMMANT